MECKEGAIDVNYSLVGHLNITRLECKGKVGIRDCGQGIYLNITRLECKEELSQTTAVRQIWFEYNQIGM